MWPLRHRDHIQIPEPEAFDLPLYVLQPDRLAHERDDIPGFKQRAQFVIGQWGAVLWVRFTASPADDGPKVDLRKNERPFLILSRRLKHGTVFVLLR